MKTPEYCIKVSLIFIEERVINSDTKGDASYDYNEITIKAE